MPFASLSHRLTARSSRGRIALGVAAVLLACPAFAQDGRALNKEKPKATANKTPEKAAVDKPPDVEASRFCANAAPSIAEHPIGLLRELNFRVTVNTDNRLMSGITLSSEMHALTDAFGYGWDDLQWLTINAMKSAFVHFDERLELINRVIKPGYAPRLGTAAG